MVVVILEVCGQPRPLERAAGSFDALRGFLFDHHDLAYPLFERSISSIAVLSTRF